MNEITEGMCTNDGQLHRSVSSDENSSFNKLIAF